MQVFGKTVIWSISIWFTLIPHLGHELKFLLPPFLKWHTYLHQPSHGDLNFTFITPNGLCINGGMPALILMHAMLKGRLHKFRWKCLSYLFATIWSLLRRPFRQRPSFYDLLIPSISGWAWSATAVARWWRTATSSRSRSMRTSTKASCPSKDPG